MFKTALFLLCSVAILVSGADDSVTSSSSTSSTTHVTSTTEQPITSTTTNMPSTTIPPKTTSVIPTSSDAPSTTSSTVAPTTSTSSPSTTPAPTPGPVPQPATGKWVVNETGQVCIIAQMAVQFNFTFMTKENKTSYKILNLPVSNETTHVNGTCGTATDMEQNITLSWHSTNLTATPNNLTFHFVKNTTNYALHCLEVYVVPEEFPNIQANYSTKFIHTSDQFTTALKNSYRCLKTQTLNFTTADNKNKTGEIEVSNLQFQAFHAENTAFFGFAEDCAFDTPDIVPIAVGCALATLVVIVLIAYLVGRRRSQARGYLSM